MSISQLCTCDWQELKVADLSFHADSPGCRAQEARCSPIAGSSVPSLGAAHRGLGQVWLSMTPCWCPVASWGL